MPIVSVVIPTRNRFEMLVTAVKSVLEQTYQDFEIIIIDDASTDRTSSILAYFDDERIRYFRNEENIGGSASRNIGISNSKGLYIGFLDDDDEWLPTKLEKQITLFNEKPDIAFMACGFYFYDTKRKKIIYKVFPKYRGNIYCNLLWGNTITTSTVLINKSVFNDDTNFDVELPRLQDWDMWLQISKHSRFDAVFEALVVLNIHEKDRISTDDEASLIARKRILEKYWQDICKNDQLLSKHYLRIGSALCQLGHMEDGRTFFKKSLKHYPRNINSMIALIVSLLGRSGYRYSIELNRMLNGYYLRLKMKINEINYLKMLTM